jgi:hypothetical protein
MDIDWMKLGAALLLLLTPIGLFHGRQVRYRAIQREWTDHLAQIASLGLHTIDFLRAIAGAALLAGAVSRTPEAQAFMRYAPAFIQAGVLLTAAGLQTAVCRELDALHAPYTFVAGVMLGFFPPAIACFALLFAVVITLGMRVPAAFFPITAMAIVALGVLFAGRKLLLELVAGACVALLPWLASIMFRRNLVISYRTRRTSERTSATRAETAAPAATRRPE